MTENTIVNFTDTATGWQRAFYAFLAEKEQRSGSRRTVGGFKFEGEIADRSKVSV